MYNGTRYTSYENNWSTHNLNSRGNQWREDVSSPGQRLMRKMGWKMDEGLGKSGNGIKEPIRLVTSRDQAGVGFNPLDSTKNWLSNQVDFDSVLSSLQQEHAAPSKLKKKKLKSGRKDLQALEQKSKMSTHRVHYHRVIRSKDMSNCSDSDWKCILGQKRKPPETPFQEETVLDVGSEYYCTAAVNSETYFLEKRLKWGTASRLENSGDQETDKSTSESFDYWSQEEHCVLEETSTSVTEEPMREKKKKKCKGKKKKKRKTSQPLQEEDSKLSADLPAAIEVRSRVEKENNLQADDSLVITRRKKKKKKKVVLQMTNVNNEVGSSECSSLQSRDTSLEEPYTNIRCYKDNFNQNELKSCLNKKPLTKLGPRPERKVTFVNEPLVKYITGYDPVRGGAWVWKKKKKKVRL